MRRHLDNSRHGTRRPEAVATCVTRVAILAIATTGLVAGCAVSASRPPVMYATGQIMRIASPRIECDLGTLKGVQPGSALLAFEVLEEQVDPRTEELVRVRLAPVAILAVEVATPGRCVAQAATGVDHIRPGLYVRLVDRREVAADAWWEDAPAWWRSISNRNAIVGADRTLPFYHGKSKRNRAE